MTKNKILTAGILIATACFLVALYPQIEARILFYRLWLNRDNTAIARKTAEHLAKTRAGIRVCVNDICVYGGRTKGWSSYAIKKNTLPDYTHKRLVNLLEHATSLSQKVEAYILLWETQKETKYLVGLYELVKTAAKDELALPAERGYGREFLATLFKESSNAEDIFNKPVNQELDLPIDDFRIFTEEYFSDL